MPVLCLEGFRFVSHCSSWLSSVRSTCVSCVVIVWVNLPWLMQGCGKLQSLFVVAMVNEARTEKDMQVWQTTLRSVLNTLKQTTFTNAAALQSKLFALDVFFRPPVIQRLLVGAFFPN